MFHLCAIQPFGIQSDADQYHTYAWVWMIWPIGLALENSAHQGCAEPKILTPSARREVIGQLV